MLTLAATEGVGLVLLVPLLQLVGVDGTEASVSGLSARVQTAFGRVGLAPTLGPILVVFIGIAAIQSQLQRWQTTLSSSIQYDVAALLRRRTYQAIARADWQFVARSRQSDFTFVLTHVVDRVGTASYYLIDLTVSAIVALVYVAFALVVSARMTGLVLCCGAGLTWLLRGRLRDSRESGEQMSTSWAELYRAIAEHLSSIKTARSYDRERQHGEIFDKLSAEVLDVNSKTVADQARLRQHVFLASAVTLAAVVYVSRAILALPPAHLLLMLFLFVRLMPRLTGLVERVQSLAVLLPAVAVVRDLEVRSQAAAQPDVAADSELRWSREIRLDDVSFEYGDDQPTVALRDVNMIIRAGSTTAIVGPSGAGKSTIADLLLGLLSPTTGAIRIDGSTLSATHLRAWRRQAGYVAQETFLFHDTVRANLVWASPDATEEQLWRAMGLAGADEFVRNLPQGLDTVLGDRGTLISGGERQRLALARALLRQPQLLILDEATSALDSENERRIQQAIEGLWRRMTIVVITHRLSTIRAADMIYTLDGGRVVDAGTWEQLSGRRDGRFAQLCRAQGLTEPVARGDLAPLGPSRR